MKNLVSFETTATYQLNVLYVYGSVTHYDTDNDMSTKWGRYFEEGDSTNIKSSLNKNNAWVFTKRSQMKIYIKKDETIIYSKKYVTTYLSFLAFLLNVSWYV